MSEQREKIAIVEFDFAWEHDEFSENPTTYRVFGNGYSAYVLILYEGENNPEAHTGTWNGVAQNRGQSGFSTKEAAIEYCETTIREFAQEKINAASNFIALPQGPVGWRDQSASLAKMLRLCLERLEILEGKKDYQKHPREVLEEALAMFEQAAPGQPELSEIEKAYGLLWRYMGPNGTVHTARRILLSLIDKDGQRRGVQFAKENTPPVSEAEILRIDDGPVSDDCSYSGAVSRSFAESLVKDILEAERKYDPESAEAHLLFDARKTIETLLKAPGQPEQPSVAEAARTPETEAFGAWMAANADPRGIDLYNAALRAQLADARKVKPLEWVHEEARKHWPESWTADTSVGEYRIEFEPDEDPELRYVLIYAEESTERFTFLKEAKDHAQSLFQYCIKGGLSALEGE